MNISAVSGASSYVSPPKQDSALKALEKQKAVLEEQKEKVKQSDMDSKLKQETLRVLDEQIAQIESQIREQKIEKLNTAGSENSKTNSSTSDASSSRTDKTDSVEKTSSGGINSRHILSAVSEYSDLKTMSRVRTDLQGQLRIATSSGENSEAGAGIQAKIESLEADIGKKSGKIGSDLKKVAEEVKDAKTPAEEIQETTDASQDENQDDTPEVLPIGSYIDVWV
jgi:hypothetical protein